MSDRNVFDDDDLWKATLVAILLVLSVLFLGISFTIWLSQYLL